MELTKETQYKAVQPQQWQVGDLIKNEEQAPLLVIYVDYDDTQITYLGLIDANGATSELRQWSENRDASFQHNTGLTYQFRNQEQVERDNQNGLFTPYFEIL